MFNKGEYIVHGRKGVCKVEDITHLDIDGADKKSLYYVLIPMKNPIVWKKNMVPARKNY